MFVQQLNLTEPPFWIAFLAALVLLTPLTSPRWRRAALALVNLGFLLLVLGSGALWVAVGLVASWWLLHFTARPRGGPLALGIAVPLFGLLFLLNKLPDFWPALGSGLFSPYLAAMGYSYVALRLVEIFRHTFETRQVPAPLATINYLVPFHMLAAGPIQAYRDFRDQPKVPAPLTREAALYGTERIVLGLFKKLVLAHTIDELFLTGFNAGGWYWLIEMQFFFLWLYLDFSAYSDIAVGMGRLMGVATPENFNRPYLARNMIDFWERWHISLSGFIRRNLFIPLQLMMARRTPRHLQLLPASVAFTVSFLLCGLWHDISPAFLAWGAMHAVGLVITNAYRHLLARRLGRKGMQAYLDNPYYRVLAIFLTYQYVALSLVLIV